MKTTELVAIGCSAGGLYALQVVLGGLAPNLPAAVVIVNHTGSSDVQMICDLLAPYSHLPVVEATERCELRSGVVHVAPSGYHLLIGKDRHFELSLDPKVCFVRPSIDVLFESAADVYGSNLVGVILTGANHDGAQGLQRIRRLGGIGIVQDPTEAQAPVMPQTALELAGADHCLPLARIALQINRLCLS